LPGENFDIEELALWVELKEVEPARVVELEIDGGKSEVELDHKRTETQSGIARHLIRGRRHVQVEPGVEADA
jgi:hypothetical protein